MMLATTPHHLRLGQLATRPALDRRLPLSAALRGGRTVLASDTSSGEADATQHRCGTGLAPARRRGWGLVVRFAAIVAARRLLQWLPAAAGRL